jgi:hypothetical protein
MRPVVQNKGGKGAYPYDLTTDFGATRWPRNFTSGGTVDNYFGKTNPTMQQTLDVMVTNSKFNNKQLGKKRPLELDCVGEIDTKLGVYSNASFELLNNLGEYCAYCEIFNPGGFDVEHGAPLSQYPSYSIVWDNLLLACKPCNEGGAKGETPTRAEAKRDWLSGNANPTEAEYYAEVRQAHYIWPDVDQYAYRTMPPSLYWLDVSTWREVAYPIATDQFVTALNPNDRVVDANVWVDIATQRVETVACLIDNVAPYPNEAQRMIDLCKLNIKRTGPSVTFDRRRYIRTNAWFTALAQLATLRNQTAATFDTAWRAMLQTARTAGFYSVWVRVFELAGDHDPTDVTNTRTFVSRFVTDSNSNLYFPNTRVAQVP